MPEHTWSYLFVIFFLQLDPMCSAMFNAESFAGFTVGWSCGTFSGCFP